MKLLILTQKVDINDGVSGFFHGWLRKLAEEFDQLVVVCLEKGKHNLPPNVKVLSLGKEQGKSRLKYLFRFYRYIWQERRNYDAVFVHMNAIYTVLGGLFWRVRRKKILLWHNHIIGGLIVRIAAKMADDIFYTSPFSFAARYKKSHIMPAGIDTEIFKKGESVERKSNSILYLGRVSPIKNIDILIEAAGILDERGVGFLLNIFGGPSSEKDVHYFNQIKNMAKKLEEKGKIKFWGSIPNYQTPQIYNQNEIFVNMTNFGSLDKAVLEAMACEILVVASNESFRGILPEDFIFKEKDALDFANKLFGVLRLGEDRKERIRKQMTGYVLEKHSLGKLVKLNRAFCR